MSPLILNVHWTASVPVLTTRVFPILCSPWQFCSPLLITRLYLPLVSILLPPAKMFRLPQYLISKLSLLQILVTLDVFHVSSFEGQADNVQPLYGVN